MIKGMKDAIRFILALLIITTIALSVAHCTQETINRL
jgi:hypothetical protein